MVNILGIHGSRVKNGNTHELLKQALSQAEQHQAVSTELIALTDKEINPCNHCNWCVKSQAQDKYCTQDDGMSDIYPKLLAADGILLASPSHFGRLSGLMADMIDRTRAFVHGKHYKLPLKNKIGGALAVAFFRGGGIETTLSSINLMFHVHRMIPANSGLYQLGAAACSSPDGKGRFEKEPRHIVLEDDYGILSAKMLADRVIELATIMNAGMQALQQKGS